MPKAEQLMQYSCEDQISDYCLHPSQKYVVVLADLLYVFQIIDGIICAKINTQGTQVIVDDSGLYVFVLQGTVKMFELGTGVLVYEFAPFKSIKAI